MPTSLVRFCLVFWSAFGHLAAHAAPSPAASQAPSDPLATAARNLPNARDRCARIRAAFEPLAQAPKPGAPPAVAGDWKLGRAIDLLTQLPPYPAEAQSTVDSFFAGSFTKDRFGALTLALNGPVCAPGQELEMWQATIEGARLPRSPVRLKARVARAAKIRLIGPARGSGLPEIAPTLASVRGSLELARALLEAKLLKAASDAAAAQKLQALRQDAADASTLAQRELAAAFPASRPSPPDAPEAQTWDEATKGGDFERAKRALAKEYADAVRLRGEIAKLVAAMEPIPDEASSAARGRRRRH